MFNLSLAQIDQTVIHKVGYKLTEEGIDISKSKFEADEEIQKTLTSYFLTPFKSSAYFNFDHLGTNEVYKAAAAIFKNPSDLYNQSVNIARYLYIESNDEKVQGGEFFVTYIKNCTLDNEPVEAIGFFKCEQKETYLKIEQNDEGFSVVREQGIALNKPDRACIIFNVEEKDGFRLLVAEGTKGDYWKYNFLKVKPRQDSFHQTQSYMNMCKGFVEEVLSENKEVAKADQIDLMKKSVDYFKENEKFNSKDFEKTVMHQPEIIEAFQEYKEHYQATREEPLIEDFDISSNAVKDTKKIFKSVLKLDKNFSVYIHGNKDYISHGHDDESGLSYYTLFYRSEK